MPRRTHRLGGRRTAVHGFKLALIAFWTAWFTVVVLTNVFGGLKAAGRLPPDWRFASRNYEAVVAAVSRYEPARWVAPLLYAAVVAAQLVIAFLLAGTLGVSWAQGAIALSWAGAAFGAGVLLWGAFMLADEITLKYEFERTHELLFLAQLATLLALYLLPD